MGAVSRRWIPSWKLDKPPPRCARFAAGACRVPLRELFSNASMNVVTDRAEKPAASLRRSGLSSGTRRGSGHERGPGTVSGGTGDWAGFAWIVGYTEAGPLRRSLPASRTGLNYRGASACQQDRGRETFLSESGQRAILKSDLDFDRIPPP